MDSNGLVLYIDNKPVSVLTDAELAAEPCTVDVVSGKEYIFECLGKWQLPEMTTEQELRYQWYRSSELPRKVKKAYRKKLKRIITDIREQAHRFLSTLGPEMQ
jgi:hypothetical protein